jgi:NADH dehydrogenase
VSTSDGSSRHRVVIVGGGFGGVAAVRRLRSAPVAVTLIDRRSFHLFQPLAYQVATGVLSPDEIAAPLRRVVGRGPNVRVVLGAVSGFDVAGRQVLVGGTPDGGGQRAIGYDSLIVAAGSTSSYLGHDDWRGVAPDIKSLEGMLQVRRRIAMAFEAAELEPDPERRAAWLTFVVVGAGPTGVELAGQIGELARTTLRRDFRAVDTGRARILLVERADRVLPSFPARLSRAAARALEQLGVTPLLGSRLLDIVPDGVSLEPADHRRDTLPARTVVWAAGVAGAELAETLAAASGAGLERGRRVAVRTDLTVTGHPEIFVIGDMAQLHDTTGKLVPLPGLAPVAMQQGRYVAQVISDRLRHAPRPRPFRYRDKGDLATIGRAKAVGVIGRHVQVSGLPAWLTWLLVHLFYLVGLQNRLVVLVRWAFSYVTRRGGVRLVAPDPSSPTERSRSWPSPSAAATSHPSPHSAGTPSRSSSSSASAWDS